MESHTQLSSPLSRLSFTSEYAPSVADQDGLDAEINALRDSIKLKTARLCEMEGKKDAVSGYFLSPTKPSDLVRNDQDVVL